MISKVRPSFWRAYEKLAPVIQARARLAYDEVLAHQMALARGRGQRQALPAPVVHPGEAAAALEAAGALVSTEAGRVFLEFIRASRRGIVSERGRAGRGARPWIGPCPRAEGKAASRKVRPGWK